MRFASFLLLFQSTNYNLCWSSNADEWTVALVRRIFYFYVYSYQTVALERGAISGPRTVSLMHSYAAPLLGRADA